MTVPELPADELLRLWKSGVPLDSAWEEFAGSFLVTVLRAHPNNDPLLFGLHNPQYKELVKAGLPNTEEARKKMLERVTPPARAKLIRALYAGRRLAIGYRTLADGAKELVRVPCNHFLTDHKKKPAVRPNIDWAKSELAVGSDSYVDIHVVRAPGETVEQDEESKGGGGLPVKGRKGRRGTKRKILDALEELWPDPVFQALEDRTEQARALRAHVLGEAARLVDRRQGYVTESLVRLIGEYATAQESEEN
jgi:hypothetical protein